jgi:hypothetical protein
MSNYLEANIKSLLPHNPTLSASLISIQQASKYEIFIDEKDNANINIIDKESFDPLYISKPIDETIEKYKEHEKYSRYPYLYFFGIGNGVFYKMLLGNEEHKSIMIIEPEIELIYIVFHLHDFSKELSSKRVQIYLPNQLDFVSISSIINSNEARLFLKIYFLEPLVGYYNRYHDEIIRVNQEFTKAIEHSIYALGNDAKDALLGLQHHIHNIDKMVQNPSLFEFVKKVKNTDTAIIVSTGPSLHKQLSLLKKIQDSVTIFCIDASFVVLNEHGIKPDIVVSLERIFNTSMFFRDIDKEYFKDVIFALTSIQHKATLSNIKDGTMMISQRPFGYTNYFDLVEYGYVGIGMSAANMAYELAYHSKFEQVILIGQDLAYGKDGTTHTKGHKFGVSEFKPRANDLQTVAYGGEGVVNTTKIWTLFRNFFESDIAQTPDMKCINSTEGGARIEGSIEIPFTKAIEMYVDKNRKKDRIVLDYPTPQQKEANSKKIKQKIEYMLKYAHTKLTEVTKLFLEVAQECETIEKNSYNIKKLNTKKVLQLIDKIDIVKDNFNDIEFVNIFNDVMQAWIVTQELELAKIQVRHIANEDDRLLKLQDWLLSHKLWLFSVAGSINANIEAIFLGLDDDNIPKEEIDNLLQYYDGNRVDYEMAKVSNGLKDRLWPYEKHTIPSRVEYLLSRISQTQEDKIYLTKELKKRYIKATGWEYRPHYDIAQVALCEFIEYINDYQLKLIKKELQPNKQNIMIYIKDETINITNNVVVNSWMRKRLDDIISLFDKDKYNILVSIDKPLNADNSADGIMDDILDIIPTHNPYLLGLSSLDRYSFFDYIITTKVEDKEVKCVDFTSLCTNIVVVKEKDFEKIVHNILGK